MEGMIIISLKQKEMNMSKPMIQPKSDFDAKFLGWQEKKSADIFPLFNITLEDHPLYQSTVSEATLRKLRLRVPQTPSPYPDTAPDLWHKLGIELNGPKTAREAIEAAGLDYTVVKKPLGLKTGLNQESYSTVRTDTGDILGVVGENYEPVQNINAFTFFDTLVADEEAVYETAGVFGKGECVWILAKLPGYLKVHGNDIVNKYLLLTNNHDGSSQVRVKFTPVRVICNNTLTSALQGTGEVQIVYTQNVEQDLKQAGVLLGWVNYVYEQLNVMFNGMAAKSITQEQLREYVQALVPDNEETDKTSKNDKVRASVLKLHDSGRGAYLARGTLWGAFNSVAEYADHMMSDEDLTLQLNSNWFGRGEQLKLKAFHLARRMMMWPQSGNSAINYAGHCF
jgi:phage/plasmid-like protein (TIGR03299 family)